MLLRKLNARIALLALALFGVPTPALAGLFSDERVSIKYDKFRDSTLLFMEPVEVAQELKLSAYAAFPGKVVGTPDHVILRLDSHSNDWIYLRNQDLVILADGERWTAHMKRNSHVGSGYVSEHLSTAIPVPWLIKLVDSSSVEGRIFLTEFSLDSHAKESLKAFIGRLGLLLGPGRIDGLTSPQASDSSSSVSAP